MPIRIQRQRVKGWRMPQGAVSVTRPGKHGNPFRIGGHFRVGQGGDGTFIWLESYLGGPGFTLVENAFQAVDMFRLMRERYPMDLSDLRGKDLACWCRLGSPCHADVLLEMANR